MATPKIIIGAARLLMRLGAVWFALAAVGGCVVNRVAFYPQKLPETWRAARDGEEFWFDAGEGGAKMHGVVFRAAEPRGVVVFSHGNAENVEACQYDGMELRNRLGVTVVVWDFPGYGKSGGRPSPSTMLRAGRAAVAAAAELTGEAPERMVMMGRSIGGAVAVDSARHFNARGLVVLRGFASLRAMAARVAPFLPWSLMLAEPLDSEAKIAGFGGAAVIQHGTADRTVPFSHGERLFAAAREPKLFVVDQNGGHNDPESKEFFQQMEAFLVEHGALEPKREALEPKREAAEAPEAKDEAQETPEAKHETAETTEAREAPAR